jgi:hypothetical protein
MGLVAFMSCVGGIVTVHFVWRSVLVYVERGMYREVMYREGYVL